MKKQIFLLILGILLLPSIIFAEELPREGVTYFITYPNGHEVITENYNEAVNPEEIIIYEGNTNTNGEIVVNDILPEGQLRIIEDVPFGYSTDQSEIQLNLSDETVAQFVNSRGIVNPKTGQSLLFVLILLVLAGIVAYYLRDKLKQAQATQLGIIILAIILGYSIINVNAAEVKSVQGFEKAASIKKNIIISVNDNHGKRMNNVRVKVYAKPISVEASPAIKFSASGGEFFDGTDLIYYRLPYDGCTVDEFYNFLGDSERQHLNTNRRLATREGYSNIEFGSSGEERELEPSASYAKRMVEEVVAKKDSIKSNDKYYNGQIIGIKWQQNSDVKVITYHLNGGIINFYGKKLTSIKKQSNNSFENNNIFESYLNNIENSNYLVGFSDEEQCSDYAPYGIKQASFERKRISTNKYACWNSKPDGIYINDILFIGDTDSCFSNNMFSTNYSRQAFSITNNLHSFVFFDITSDQIGISSTLNVDNIPVISGEIKDREDNKAAEEKKESSEVMKRELSPNISNNINSIVIIYKGQVISSLTSNDFTCSRDYCLFNSNNNIKDYFTNLGANCIKNLEDNDIKIVKEKRR